MFAIFSTLGKITFMILWFELDIGEKSQMFVAYHMVHDFSEIFPDEKLLWVFACSW